MKSELKSELCADVCAFETLQLNIRLKGEKPSYILVFICLAHTHPDSEIEPSNAKKYRDSELYL